MTDPAQIFDDLLRAFKAATTDEEIEAFAAAFHRFQDQAEESIYGERVKTRTKAQPIQFLTHYLPLIQSHMRTFPARSRFSILDIGPGIGTGANTLGQMYSGKGLGYGATVSTIDFKPRNKKFARTFLRYIRPHYGDIFKHEAVYDIVIASHVIEHVSDPLAFVRRMREMSRGIAIVCAPYREPHAAMSPAHINSIDDDFIRNLNAERVEIVRSPGWGQFKEPPYEMFAAVLKGLQPPLRQQPNVMVRRVAK